MITDDTDAIIHIDMEHTQPKNTSLSLGKEFVAEPVTDLVTLRAEVAGKYEEGHDALFTYMKKGATEDKNVIATLTLDEALRICGPLIASEGKDSVLATLDRMYSRAKTIENNPELMETTRRMGQVILQKYRH